MSEDLKQHAETSAPPPTLPPAAPPALPTWIEFPLPGEVHRAAFAGWLHTPTGALVLKLWHGCDSARCRADCGRWTYQVRHPGGRSALAYATVTRAEPPLSAVMEAAAVTIEQLEAEMRDPSTVSGRAG